MYGAVGGRRRTPGMEELVLPFGASLLLLESAKLMGLLRGCVELLMGWMS